ncbi:tol-pal system protein YbgF [Loktanella sp. IMCC34160]|uniref:tol-pal system protein YbgF n=1 Tax=Loktanella sp. IMCC34160 TaxID=2510646 RepID=UPI00101C732F|nr:tol-pal system protein YbgF [Loktanella sp. IMCC34160]RYG90818.1 tol-pal system protein YbgF [Loktanella sp. IMCC34160]
MFRSTAAAIAIMTGLALPAPVAAQDQTLADIRQELSVLYVEIQRLKVELSTTGAPTTQIGGNTPLERLDSIEAQLQLLTSKTEELEFRINRITADGTNRIGDLEFRLCELEEGCDIGALGDTPSLGGIDNAVSVPTAQPDNGGPVLAINEQSDFERAEAALSAGDFRGAADQFAAFVQTYPGGPLNARAHYLRGEALESMGEMTNAARAYLESFSTDQAGDTAPDALFKLGFALGAIGQVQDACITLAEVGTRFPGSEASFDADTARRTFGCQ